MFGLTLSVYDFNNVWKGPQGLYSTKLWWCCCTLLWDLCCYYCSSTAVIVLSVVVFASIFSLPCSGKLTLLQNENIYLNIGIPQNEHFLSNTAVSQFAEVTSVEQSREEHSDSFGPLLFKAANQGMKSKEARLLCCCVCVCVRDGPLSLLLSYWLLLVPPCSSPIQNKVEADVTHTMHTHTLALI